MSMSLRLISNDSVDEYHLASGTGWTDFCQWVKKLPSEDHMKKFCRTGKATDTLQLSNELKRAYDEHRPLNQDVLDVAEHLIDHIGIGDSDEIAEVNDGFADDGEAEFGDDHDPNAPENPYAQSWFMTDSPGLQGASCCYIESSRNGVQPYGVLSWLLGGASAINMANLQDDDLIHKCVDSLPDELRAMGQKYFIEGKVKRWLGAVNGDPGGYPAPKPKDRHIVDHAEENPRLFMVGDYLFDSTLNGVVASAKIATDMLIEEVNHMVVMSLIKS